MGTSSLEKSAVQFSEQGRKQVFVERFRQHWFDRRYSSERSDPDSYVVAVRDALGFVVKDQRKNR